VRPSQRWRTGSIISRQFPTWPSASSFHCHDPALSCGRLILATHCGAYRVLGLSYSIVEAVPGEDFASNVYEIKRRSSPDFQWGRIGRHRWTRKPSTTAAGDTLVHLPASTAQRLQLRSCLANRGLPARSRDLAHLQLSLSAGRAGKHARLRCRRASESQR
jgi:hypothetical protein